MVLSQSRGRRALSPQPQPLLLHPDQRPPEGWASRAGELFRQRMSARDNPYPCVFGVDALRKGSLRLAYVPAGEPRVPVLARALREYVEIAEGLGSRTSLVTIFEADPRLDSLEAHRSHFWWLLGQLRERDTTPWPAGIASDPEDPSWEFSYHGMPMFVVANTPYHRRRRSRYFEHLAITFQPRFVFDDLREGTPTGDNARAVIRRRLASYDDVPQSPLLGSFGAHGNKEWAQYFLDDDNDPTATAGRCPLHQAASGRPAS